MDPLQLLERLQAPLVSALVLFVSLVASAHVVLYKRDSRGAVSWVGVIWLAPVLGAVLYLLLGVNRIKRRAVRMRPRPAIEREVDKPRQPADQLLSTRLEPEDRHLSALGRLLDDIAFWPLAEGNRVEPLVDGDQAYPAMLEAIDGAESSVALLSYIFDRDEVGLEFARRLGRAARRGVEVRVLVDAVGSRYGGYRTIIGELRRRGVRAERFLPTLLPWRLPYMNLRNHRKLLVVDGQLAFTGGMNIREGHVLARQPEHPVRDVAFRVEGPVVGDLMRVFAEDWAFTTGEQLDDRRWQAEPRAHGQVLARCVSDGPDEDFEQVVWLLHGAVSSARRSIRIVTPYFLPGQELLRALNVAALRGVEVELFLPERNNQPLVHWATMATLWQLLEHPCKVYLTPPPFDHAKLMVVDSCWSCLGSTNWDARSLRLSFELNLECYDQRLAALVEGLIDERRRHARALSLDDVDGRRLPARLRDGVARLLSPYL